MALGKIATGGTSALEVLRRYSPIRDRLRRHVVGVTRTQPITTRAVVAFSPRPLQAGNRITGGIVCEQKLDQCDDVSGFFSTGLRPPPERRVRSEVTL